MVSPPSSGRFLLPNIIFFASFTGQGNRFCSGSLLR